MHNSSKYDTHLIIRDIVSIISGRLQIIAKNTESYIAIIAHVANTWIKFHFIDSLKFLSTSLETLIDYLPIEEKQLLRNHCENEEQFNLLTRKGFFPYEYITSFEKLNDPLPDMKGFYNSLKGDISRENYQHVINMWNAFNMQNLGDLSNVYLKVDVLLLCCVFEAFRKTCMTNLHMSPFSNTIFFRENYFFDQYENYLTMS